MHRFGIFALNINQICEKLVDDLGCTLLSGIEPAPDADIDIYVPASSQEDVLALARREGFILTSSSKGQFVFRRFENNGFLYILDLMVSFDAYTRQIATMELSQSGHEKVGASASLHKSFKYLCTRKTAKLKHIAAHQEELIEFLRDGKNFVWVSPHILAAASLPTDSLMKAVFRPSADKRFVSRFLKNMIGAQITDRTDRLGTGVSLAFIGPDGSGKTFFIERFKAAGNTRNIYMGDWFFALQPLYNLLLRIPSPWNRFVYALYPIENYARLFKVLYWRFIGRIVLIDRFPGTNRNVVQSGGLGWLNRLTFRVFPKPDLVVFLYAKPEIIYQRKQELSVGEIGAIQEMLKALLKGTRHQVVDTEMLDASLNGLLAEISQ